MPPGSSKYRSLARGWQEPSTITRPGRLGLHARRAALSVSLIGLVGVLCYLLLAPYWQPRTHVVILRAGTLQALHGPPVPVAGHEVELFEKLDDLASYHPPSEFDRLFASPDDLDQLGDQLQQLKIRKSDVLILYVAAHGVSYGGQAYLVCNNFDPATPGDGLYRVSRLLRQVAAVPAKVKFVAMDAGRIDYDPRLGIVGNEFPTLLKQSLQEEFVRPDGASPWVLCSHSSLQSSYRSSALNGSVFGTFLAAGLHGAADSDGNGNGIVDTGELAKFVRANVAAWVQQVTGGQSTQTPILLGGAGSFPKDGGPSLLSVVDVPPASRRVKIPELIRTAQIGPPASGLRPFAPVMSPRGFLSQIAISQEESALPGDGTGKQPSPPQAETASPQGKASTGPTTSTSDGQQADGGGSSPAEEAKAGDDGKPSPESESLNPRQQLLASLDKAWQLRDQLATGASTGNLSIDRPVDDIPHVWRQLQEELVAYEQLALAGQSADLATLQQMFDEAVTRLTNSVGDPQTKPDLLRLTGGAPSRPPAVATVPFDDVRSLALARLLADHGAIGPGDDVGQLLANLVAQIDGPPEELKKTIAEKKNWEPHYDKYCELRLIKQLADVPNVEPALLQLALKARLKGEEAAAGALGDAGWLSEQIATADQLRLAGECQVFDQIGSGWRERAHAYLTGALDAYATLERIRESIRQATRLRNDLVFRAPYYVRAYQPSEERDGAFAPNYASLSEFFDKLIDFSAVLDDPAPQRISEVTRLRRDLTRLAQEIDVPDRSIDNLARPGGFSARDAWCVNRLLATPLPTERSRRDLLRAVTSFDAKLASRFTLADNHLKPDERPDWTRQFEQCSLEMKLAQLATWNETADSDFQKLQAAYDTLQEKREESAARDAPRVAEEEIWNGIDQFSDKLRRFYDQALPRRIAKVNATNTRLPREEAIRVRRALQLIDARDAWRFRDVRVASLFTNTSLYDMLLFQQHRLLQAEADAAAGEMEYLREAAGAYRSAAAKVFRPTRWVASVGQQVHLRVPKVVSLVGRPTSDVSVSFTYSGATPADAWVILQYDPKLVQIDAKGTVYREHELKRQIEESLDDRKQQQGIELPPQTEMALQRPPYRPDLVLLPPTYKGVAGGLPKSLKLKVTSQTRDVDAARILVKVITRPSTESLAKTGAGDAADGAPEAATVSYVRQKIDLPMRVLEVVLAEPATTWTSANDRLTLQPFPNRLSDYRFGVVNHESKQDDLDQLNARNVRLTFFAIPSAIDISTLPPARVAELVDRLTPIGEPLKLPAVAPDGKAHFAGENADDQEAVPGGEAKGQPAEPEEKPSEEPKPPQGTLLDHGLLVEVRDMQDPTQTYVQQIDIVAQRPRRYVQPQVGYNAEHQRIEVHVRPRLRSLLPADPVRVECQIAEDLATATGGKLQGELKSPNFDARLFVNVPATPPQTVTLYLHVDGYPRAFVYRVPCSGHSIDVVEETEWRKFRITNLATTKEYQPPAPSTPIEVQVDAPVGTFQSGSDFTTLALDEDGDGEVGPFEARNFVTDRQVRPYVVVADGIMSLDTHVSDFHVPLPTSKLQNVHIAVLGQVDARNVSYEASPVTLNIDGAPPRISRVHLSTIGDVAVAGTPLEVAVWVSDDMSGVKQVEVAFDLAGTGDFAEDAKPVQAVLESAVAPSTRCLNCPSPGLWIARLPTDDALGWQTVLVRATDRVGNHSPSEQEWVRVVTPEQVVAIREKQTKMVQGMLAYRNEAVPSAELKLSDEEGAEVASVQANDQGEFLFPAVPPGKYKLDARGVVRNIPRFGSLEIVIDPTPGRVVQADIELQ